MKLNPKSLATFILLGLYGFLVLVVAGTFIASGLNRHDDAITALGIACAVCLLVGATVGVRGIWRGASR